ncbi:MAG TPA: hypothetical protein QKA14_00995 [Candidatus Megaira endosymbiont of Hartmannula sinica]|nr:hypothetical protein [Candidatus Megaera endosymbiont of Hartmannula sinica]
MKNNTNKNKKIEVKNNNSINNSKNTSAPKQANNYKYCGMDLSPDPTSNFQIENTNNLLEPFGFNEYQNRAGYNLMCVMYKDYLNLLDNDLTPEAGIAKIKTLKSTYDKSIKTFKTNNSTKVNNNILNSIDSHETINSDNSKYYSDIDFSDIDFSGIDNQL